MSGLWTYHDLLPPVKAECRLSLGEGHTPLVRSRSLGSRYDLSELYFKLESLNPTGSYKDRFAALALSGLAEKRATVCLATSSGNTGASLAAYAARAGLPCFIAVVDGAPLSKVRQMQVYGASTFSPLNFGREAGVTKQVFDELERLAGEYRSEVQISAFHYSPIGMAGVQTIAYELAEQLPTARHIFTPSGGGGLTLAVARGYERRQERVPLAIPQVHTVQPSGNNTIAGPLRQGLHRAESVPHSTTRISGLQVPTVIDGDAVIHHLRKSAGQGYLVEDEEVFSLQQELAQREGIYCEPAGAVALAGAIAARRRGEVGTDEPVVCLITGHGFKDEPSVRRITGNSDIPSLSHVSHIKKFIRKHLKKPSNI